MAHTVTFLDAGLEPKCPPDPAHPNGVHVIMALARLGRPTCEVNLPYPAPRCGLVVVKCDACGLSVGLTVAGRPDDPCAITLACRDLHPPGARHEASAA
jgi:hypothetical protein